MYLCRGRGKGRDRDRGRGRGSLSSSAERALHRKSKTANHVTTIITVTPPHPPTITQTNLVWRSMNLRGRLGQPRGREERQATAGRRRQCAKPPQNRSPHTESQEGGRGFNPLSLSALRCRSLKAKIFMTSRLRYHKQRWIVAERGARNETAAAAEMRRPTRGSKREQGFW